MMADTPDTARRIAEFVNYLDTLTAKLAEVEAERDALRAALARAADDCHTCGPLHGEAHYEFCTLAPLLKDSPSPVEGGQ
jgi:ABC-type transporter Mla subunit MlaD